MKALSFLGCLPVLAFPVLLAASCKASRPLSSWNQVIVESEAARAPLHSVGGKMKILFPGYVHCPDICTPAAVNMDRAAMALGARALEVEFLFMSVDPDHDSIAALKEFETRLGTKHLIYLRPLSGHEGLFRELGIITRPGEAGTIDHSPFLYFISGDNRLLAAFPASTSPSRLADEIRLRL